MRNRLRNFIFNSLSIYKTALKPELSDAMYFRLRKKPNIKILKILYALFSRDYELVTTERIVEVPFVFSNLILKKCSRILDFGCNFSKLSIELASLGYRVTGADLNDYEFDHPNFSFIKGNFPDNKIEDNSFDAAVAVSSVEHCGLASYGSSEFDRGDIKIVDRIHKALKKGGRFIMSVPYGRSQICEAEVKYRVYNEGELKSLTRNFRLVKEEYFVGIDRKHWTPAGKKELAGVSSADKGFVQGVACIVLEK